MLRRDPGSQGSANEIKNSTQTRTLVIPFYKDTKQIEISGDKIDPAIVLSNITSSNITPYNLTSTLSKFSSKNLIKILDKVPSSELLDMLSLISPSKIETMLSAVSQGDLASNLDDDSAKALIQYFNLTTNRNNMIKILDSRTPKTILDFLNFLPQSKSESFLNGLSIIKRIDVLNEITYEIKYNDSPHEQMCGGCHASVLYYTIPTIDVSSFLQVLLTKAPSSAIPTIPLTQYYQELPDDVVKALLRLSSLTLAKILLNLSSPDLVIE